MKERFRLDSHPTTWSIWLERNARVFRAASRQAFHLASHTIQEAEQWSRAVLIDDTLLGFSPTTTRYVSNSSHPAVPVALVAGRTQTLSSIP